MRYRGKALTNPCPTLETLLELGFEDRPPVMQVAPSIRWMVPQVHQSPLVSVCYRFADFDLVASPTLNSFNVPVVGLTGYREDDRSVSIIEGQIPSNLRTSLEAAAWISFALRSQRSELEPLPDWFIEGEGNWDLVWPVIEGREAYERRRAYESCPKCHIDRDYARVLRRNLSEELSWLGEEAGMTFSFDGRVLSIVTDQRVHELVASGNSWPSSYRVIVSPESKLPAKFTSWRVEISVFEGFVSFDRLRLGLCEPVE